MSDFDDLDRLKAALQAPPAPDASAKAAALRIAQENFDRLQETTAAARPTQTQAEPAGILKGLKTMFATISMKPLLLTTSSLVVIGVGFVVLQSAPQPDLSLGLPGVQPRAEIENDRAQQQDREVITLEEASPAQAPAFAPQKSVAADTLAASSGIMAAPMLRDDVAPSVAPNRDRFANAAPNPLKITADDPVSTFSTDIDTASYAWVRRSLQNGQLPDPASVRVEEMINYFPYDYAAPNDDVPFATTVSLSQTPWNPGTQLVHLGLQGEMPATEDRPPLNLVFLIDTSGSMSSPDKLPLLIQSFRLMLSELRPQDQVAIVTYAGSAGLVLEPTPAGDSAKINAALSNLNAGGSTAGAAGLTQAYQVAEQMAEEGDVSRVILATDGDFNVGISSQVEMKALIEAKRDSGTYLSVLGFGRGNLNDALMQTLAQNGNGQAAYIDTLSEARKVLVDQLTGALFPIASDVKLQVEWNPAQVAEYRLIGYETRALNREDFNNDAVDAGDIGAGLQVTALYEVTPVGSPAVLNDPLRYGEAVAGSGSEELGFLRLRYKEPGAQSSQLIETPITDAGDAPTPDAEFATAVAGFGQLLRGSDYLGGWSYAEAIALANASKGADPFGYRAEAVTLMRLAESLTKSR